MTPATGLCIMALLQRSDHMPNRLPHKVIDPLPPIDEDFDLTSLPMGLDDGTVPPIISDDPEHDRLIDPED
jgi:hypothetical protein